MKLTATKRADKLFDKMEFMKEIEGHLQAKGYVGNKLVYALIRDSYLEINDLVKDFESSLEFIKSIEKDPGIFILAFDLMSTRKDASKSVLPPHPTHFLLNKQGVGSFYNLLASYSNKIPKIALVFDKQGASSTFPIAMCDIVIMYKDAGMSIGREDVVKRILGKEESYDELGSATMHATISGSVDFVFDNEDDMINAARICIGHLSLPYAENDKKPYTYSHTKPIKSIIPENVMFVLDMDKLINEISDDYSFIELKKDYASEIITGFATFEGKTAAIVANRSRVKAGLFFPESCEKAERFIRMCDTFNIPIVFLADSSGFMIGSNVEQKGIIRHGANLLKTIANSKTPKLSVAVRRDYTAGVYAMGGGNISKNTKFVALPSAVITIYSENVGKSIMNDKKDKKWLNSMLKDSKSPQKLYEDGYLDKVVEFEKLRGEIVDFLEK